MRRRPFLAALLVGLLGACGAQDPPPPSADPVAQLAASAQAGEITASAFRLVAEPAGVRHELDMELFRKGVRLPDPRDAIPAIQEPRFVPAASVDFMRPERRLIRVEVGGEVRGYPLHLLDRHELVNDRFGDVPVLVSWCPLCGSSVVYDRRVGERTLTFGVSGYLYKSDVLMYDHETESFWSQLALKAVAGPLTGRPLRVLPSSTCSFGAFRQSHPRALVLDDDQGIVPSETYLQAPYRGYERMKRIWFPVGAQSAALHPKADVVGVVLGGRARAYTLAGLRRAGRPVQDTLGGQVLRLEYDGVGDGVRVRQGDGTLLPHVRLFWFAWFAFHPDTDLWLGAVRGLVADPASSGPHASGAEPPK